MLSGWLGSEAPPLDGQPKPGCRVTQTKQGCQETTPMGGLGNSRRREAEQTPQSGTYYLVNAFIYWLPKSEILFYKFHVLGVLQIDPTNGFMPLSIPFGSVLLTRSDLGHMSCFGRWDNSKQCKWSCKSTRIFLLLLLEAYPCHKSRPRPAYWKMRGHVAQSQVIPAEAILTSQSPPHLSADHRYLSAPH